ncbi:MAG: agmatinase [Methanobrevibacter sp.]|jgi:agmatinase|nr:agmatinase [Candidatus Methanovirga basalitermitum]
MLLNTYNPGIFAFSKHLHDLKFLDEIAWGILGVPFDSTSSYHAGSRLAPTLIRESSFSFEKYNFAFNKELTTSFFDLGNIDVIHGDLKRTSELVEDSVYELLSLKLKPILLGGEHSITYPAIKGLSNKFNIKEFTIIDFDAHMDMIDTYQGEKYSHGTVMRRVHDLNPKKILQLGVRSSSKEENDFGETNKDIKIFSSNDFKNLNVIKEELLAIEGPVYLSIDCDVFDPSYMPSTGNPVPNGIKISDFEELLKIIAKKDVVGFDIVELSSKTLGDPSAVTVAKIIHDFLTLI